MTDIARAGTYRRTRILRILAAVTVALPLLFSARAQAAWPDKPIKIVVPFAPGGSNDIMARLIASKLGPRMSTSVVVENKGGSGGTIGTEYVARSRPDGYTLLFASTSITTNLATSKVLRYDLEKDLEPIGTIATSPFAVVVANGVPAKTFKEFVDLARAKPGSINYGSAGVGGINHLGTALLAHEAGITLTHIPYKGISLAFTDLAGGELQMLLPTVASSVQQIRDGRMRGLAVTGAKRSPLLPELPTVSEAGLPGFELEAWFGLLGPAGMPAEVVERLNHELNAVLQSEEVRKMLEHEGATPTPGGPDVLGKLISSEIVRWKNLIKEANIKVQ